MNHLLDAIGGSFVCADDGAPDTLSADDGAPDTLSFSTPRTFVFMWEECDFDSSDRNFEMSKSFG